MWGSIKSFLGFLRFKIGSVFRAPLTIGKLILCLFTFGSIFIVGLSPILKDGGWSSLESWILALKKTWPAIIAALYLKFSEKFRSKYGNDKRVRRSNSLVSLNMSAAISNLCKTCKQNGWTAEQMRHSRETILLCVSLRIANLLGIDDNTLITANLVDFSTGNHENMRVVARSCRERETPKEYASITLLGYQAITKEAAVLVDDLKNDPRWATLPPKSYATVLSIPIVRDGKAFGALSLDCEQAYAFFGKKSEMEVEVQPFIAVIASSYGPDSISYPCGYEATHRR